MNEKVKLDLQNAMKAQDKLRLSVLRMLKSALQMESINLKKDLSDEDVIRVIKKQVKTRKDSIAEYEKYNKLDVVSTLNDEVNILSEYLPEEMSIDDINNVIDSVFEELKPSSMKDMGNIMKVLNERITNADMSLVSKLVKERLS